MTERIDKNQTLIPSFLKIITTKEYNRSGFIMSIEKNQAKSRFFWFVLVVGCSLFPLRMTEDWLIAKKGQRTKITQEAQVLVVVSPTVDPLTWMVKEVRKVNRLRDCYLVYIPYTLDGSTVVWFFFCGRLGNINPSGSLRSPLRALDVH